MLKQTFRLVCCVALFDSTAVRAEKVFYESDGLVVVEVENTESPLGSWRLIPSGTEGYPPGAVGTGHLESSGSATWGVPDSPLTYRFRINRPGKYFLRLRAHKRLEGEKGDKCNDCFISMAGDYAAGDPELPLKALQTDQKLFGGAADSWGVARMLDLKPKNFGIKNKRHLRKPAAYNFKAGEIYTLTVSGRSKRFNVDRIILNHESVTVGAKDLATFPESVTTNASIHSTIAQFASDTASGTKRLVYHAVTDFPVTDAGEAPYYYKPKGRKVLAINAGVKKYRNKFARAETTFTADAGTYDVTLRALRELDGECTYRLLVNGQVIAVVKNDETEVDYAPQDHVFPHVEVPAAATIAVESNCVTNGKIPERGGTAYARGRWSTLSFKHTESTTSNSRTLASKKRSEANLENSDGMINLILAPEEAFDGRIFFINDWDGGDADNQNVGMELNRNSRIKQNVTILSDLPSRSPRKVDVDDLVNDAQVLADASKKGKIGIAMGAHSRHLLAWLTKLPKEDYNYSNIAIVTHSNWNELDGRRGYDANKKPGDPPLEDSHGVNLRRGLYPSLAKISDLGVTILEIPRTDSGTAGWGGRVTKADGTTAGIKALDISDLGLVHYLKTGVVEATRSQRNRFVSDALKKPDALDEVDRSLITESWDKNGGVPGEKADYLPGGKHFELRK